MFEGESKERKEELRRYVKRLGELINDTLTHSEEIQGLLSQIKKFGLGNDLSMVIALGFYCPPDVCPDNFQSEIPLGGKIRFEITSEDKIFLDRLKLKLSTDNDTCAPDIN